MRSFCDLSNLSITNINSAKPTINYLITKINSTNFQSSDHPTTKICSVKVFASENFR